MLVFPEESDNPSLYDFCRGFGLDFEMWDKSILHWSICVARCFLHLIFNAGSEYADRTSQVNVLNCCEPLKLGSQYSWVQSSTKTKLFILQNKTYLRYHQFFFGRMLFTCFIRFFVGWNFDVPAELVGHSVWPLFVRNLRYWLLVSWRRFRTLRRLTCLMCICRWVSEKNIHISIYTYIHICHMLSTTWYVGGIGIFYGFFRIG